MKLPLALIASGLIGGLLLLNGGKVSPGPSPAGDVLQQSYAADRISQVAVLRDLAKQPFDGTTDDGRRKAGEWFNTQRFRNRPNDYGAYTDRVADAIASNSEDALATELEAK